MRRLTSYTALMVVVVVLAAACSTGGESVPRLGETTTSVPTSDAATTSSTTSSTTPPIETVEDFLDGFVGAYQTGNPVFLIQRIHPDLRDFYGHEACRTLYEGFVPDDTAQYSIRSITGPNSWSDGFDGQLFTFEEVYAVDVDIVDFDRVRRQDMYLARIGDRLYFFQDCGQPLVGTTTTIDPAELDPDGDGAYYVHSGAGDSEDFVVPDLFRVTYTGTDSTCAFQLLSADTGDEVRYVGGLDGGGIKRFTLPDPLTTVYVSDVLGCAGGELRFGPNP